MHVTVDYDPCAGHGQCLMGAPDVFDLPDGVEQVVVLDADPPESQRAAVVRAAAMCPAQARIPDISAPEPRYALANFINGINSLPATWTPERA